MEKCVNEKLHSIPEVKEGSGKLNQMYKIFQKKVQKIEAIQKQENEKVNKIKEIK